MWEEEVKKQGFHTSVSCSWRNWMRDEPCVSLGVGINGMFLLCLTFCCHNLLGSWIHVRAGSSSHIWVYKFVGNRKKRDKHKHMRRDSIVPLNSPGSCSPAGWALPTPWEFVLVLICQCERSLRRPGTATRSSLSLSVLCMTSPTNKQINFPHSRSWVLSEAGLGGQAGFHPSMVPLPCSSHVSAAAFPGSKPQTGAAGEDSSCLAVQGNHGNYAGQLISFQRQHSSF